ncbi:CBS domain-containing protein [Oryzibacter oryziterrae]|uniref:CBS domain-containing protein n=1 Tax=Oryzibacter oryziterrae TaxID=2766474 RepID=UPI001F4033BC|nr:CBS domain-containing protein [Oryzibacter oryziterrae]
MTTVKQILSLKGNEVVTGDSTMSLGRAVARLAEKRIGVLVMVDEARRVVGILSERDVVRVLALQGPAALDEAVSQFMTRAVSTCSKADTLEDIMEMMTTGRFRHMPVVEGGVLVGLISIGDVVKHRMAEIALETSEFRNYLFTA